jgi:hypothetical protein
VLMRATFACLFFLMVAIAVVDCFSSSLLGDSIFEHFNVEESLDPSGSPTVVQLGPDQFIEGREDQSTVLIRFFKPTS